MAANSSKRKASSETAKDFSISRHDKGNNNCNNHHFKAMLETSSGKQPTPRLVRSNSTMSSSNNLYGHLQSSSADEEVEEEDEDIGASQVTLSQTDIMLRQQEEAGELDEVSGSQSRLTQELPPMSSQGEDFDPNLGLQNSQCSETSVAMAKRFGLLMTQEEEPEEPSPKQEFSGAGIVETPAPPITSSFASGNASQEANIPGSLPQETKSSKGNFMVSDTPIRESACFGSLLEAVDAITKQEEKNAEPLWDMDFQKPKFKDTIVKSRASAAPGNALWSKISTNNNKRKAAPVEEEASSCSKDDSSSPSSKRSRKSPATKKKENQQKEEREIAKRAAALAEQTVEDPGLAKRLLLSMALVRENPRTAPASLPPRGATVPEGFFWAHYPPLEIVLKDNMAKYYELSTEKCQSAQQQAFNNQLVTLVRNAAKKQGWKFHQSFSDKCLRDRIRCYYKTHIQNAKKRLRTMVRNPTKRANARHLCAHLDLIQKHREEADSATDEDDDVEEYKESDDWRTAEILTKVKKSSPKPAKSQSKRPRSKPATQPRRSVKV